MLSYKINSIGLTVLKCHKIFISLALLFAAHAHSGETVLPKISHYEINNRILSMTITPFANDLQINGTPTYLQEAFPPNFIIYKDYANISCKIKPKGSFNFVDFEGSSFGNFKEKVTKLPHATDRISVRVKEDEDKIKINENNTIESFKLIREKYCIDAIFAPVIDYRDGGRYHYNQTRIDSEEDWFNYSSEELEFWMKAANSKGLAFTIKHYPFTTPIEKDSPDHQQILSNYEKAEKYMNGVPKEITIDTIYPDNEVKRKNLKEAQERTLKLMSMYGKGNMVMLTNRIIREYNYKPYIFTDMPQRDSFLRNFDGLIVSDDLFQLSLNEERAIQAFKNIDLAIISSPSDFQTYVSAISKWASKDPEILRLVIEKSNKVREFKKLRASINKDQ